MTSDPADRRVDPRYRVDIQVDCETRDMFVSNHVTNISRGGLFIRSERPLPIQSEIAMTFILPGAERKIRVVGRVVWNYDVQKPETRLVRGMGIKFLDMSPEDRAALEQCLSRLEVEAAPLR